LDGRPRIRESRKEKSTGSSIEDARKSQNPLSGLVDFKEGKIYPCVDRVQGKNN
jgi:hypothetical protein